MSGTAITAVILGRLTRDAELRHVGDQAIAEITVATDSRQKGPDGAWHDEPSFWDIDVWGRLGESLAPYLQRGKLVQVLAELRIEKWEKNGEKRSRVKATAIRVTLLPSGNGQAQKHEAEKPMPAPAQQPDPMPFDDEVPF